MTFIGWLVIAVVLFLLFVVGMLVGIKRKSLNTVLAAVLLCLLAMGAAGMAVYKFANFAYQSAKDQKDQ